ncbi:hypothetical protein [Oculatella sp. FACHB-28]|uniref:hypothetical protein n=1 Tax=Oculatella sp. FACHB-28 TaxID=2692845 RepID=UPI001F55848C|nr:hypothetical protein [Oculatella sp. FACHB-28]
MPDRQKPASMFEVFTTYEQAVRVAEPTHKANAAIAQLQTALLRYTLPGWGFSGPVGQRLKAAEIEAGLEHLKKVPLDQLPQAPEIQEQQFEEFEVPGNSRRNYRLALNKMMNWCRQQDWYPGSLEEQRKITPRQRARKGSAQQVRLTSRKSPNQYGLGAVEGDVLPEDLRRELFAFYQFLVNPEVRPNKEKEVGTSTAEQYVQWVLLFLGWLHRIQKVPLAQLSLKQIVAFEPIKTAQDPQAAQSRATAAAQRTMNLIEDYLNWLKTDPEATPSEQSGRGSQSPHTVSKILVAVVAVAKFLYRLETDYPRVEKYLDIPVIELLRQKQRKVIKLIRDHISVSDESKKTFQWQEFLKLVEALRQECASRFLQSTQSKAQGQSLGSVRPIRAIAQSYQRFLLAAFLAYLLPQRQRVYRNLQILRAEPSQEWHFSRAEPTTGGFLYKREHCWWMKLSSELCSQSEAAGSAQLVPVPNEKYPDGRCFYEYLEEWLVKYSGESENLEVKTQGLRAACNPQHSYVFTTKKGEPYKHPATFATLLRNPSYRLLGKVLTPELVRQMTLE